MFSLICVWISGWVNNREAAGLRRHCFYYDVIRMGLGDSEAAIRKLQLLPRPITGCAACGKKRCQIFQIIGFHCYKQARLWWPICFNTNIFLNDITRKGHMRQFISSIPDYCCAEWDPLTGNGCKASMGIPILCYRWWLFRRRSKKITELRVTGLCVGNSPVAGESPAQKASNAENVSIWWRHHGAYNPWHVSCSIDGIWDMKALLMLQLNLPGISSRYCKCRLRGSNPLPTSKDICYPASVGTILTHWGLDEIDNISQTTSSSAFSWMKMFEFRLKFQWSLFLRVQLTIFQHWSI